MVYYATIILTNVGLSTFESQLLAAVMETCFALGTWPFPWTIEIFGRRKIMLWGAAASGLAMLIFIIMIGLPHQTKATEWTAVGCVIAWMFIFGYSWNGAPWVYGPEVSQSWKLCIVQPLNFFYPIIDCTAQKPTSWRGSPSLW